MYLLNITYAHTHSTESRCSMTTERTWHAW